VNSFEQRISDGKGSAVVCTTLESCELYHFEEARPTAEVPSGYRSVRDFLRDLEKDPEIGSVLTEGRKELATALAKDPVTIRALRLRKGWSQDHLAQAMSTSQSHIARIEKGRDNFTWETLKKLKEALDVDMNTVDHALANCRAILRDDE